MMRPFISVSGTAAPLRQANIDTDVIIRIERLTAGGDLGRYAFEALRYLADGVPNPDFVLNQARYAKSPILLAGRNFGCGSSREGAVTAVMQAGISCVIAPSFGDIFFANCFRNGLLPIALSDDVIDRIAGTKGDVTVDLKSQTITFDGATISFEIDALQRDALFEGLDEIGLTLKSLDDVTSWQAADRTRRPWVWQTQGTP